MIAIGNADSQQGEISDSFSATMYLLWDPQLNASGQSTPDCAATTPETTQGLAGTPVPSTCTGSIPAPLGAITWGFCGGAINVLQTQSDGSTWTLNCKPNVDMPATPTYQDAHSISTAPSWTGVKHD
jgi:hypothetical protein